MIDQMIVCGDCTQWVEGAIYAAVMITDPPYREHVHVNATSQSKVRGTRHREMGFEHISYKLRRYVAQCAARVARWSVIYSDVESLAWWRVSCQAAGATYIRTIPWVRWSMPQLSGDRPPTGWEPVSVFWGLQKGPKAWNGPGNLTHLAHKCLRGESKHKAEKPLDQSLDLVSWFSNPGELVFDPFAGSGTVGVACAILDRNYVGFEIDPTWAKSSADRVSDAKRGIFSARDQERCERWLEVPKDESAYMRSKKGNNHVST